jgi:hypothetical protein
LSPATDLRRDRQPRVPERGGAVEIHDITMIGAAVV